MKQTTVIHIKDCPPGWQSNPEYIYIGRPSKWGNPFFMDADHDRSDVIASFEDYFFQSPELLVQVHKLQGKKLVCFCAPKPCHGDILAEWAERA